MFTGPLILLSFTYYLDVNNLVGDVKVNPKDFIGISIVRKKDAQGRSRVG